jgi:hypothetical protein
MRATTRSMPRPPCGLEVDSAFETVVDRLDERVFAASPRSAWHDHVDVMGLRGGLDTHGVDLTMKRSAWRAVPDTPGRTRIAADRGLAGDPRPPSTPHSLQMAGLGSLPNPVVTRTAVPDVLARQFSTTVTVGCHATACGPVPPPAQ